MIGAVARLMIVIDSVIVAVHVNATVIVFAPVDDQESSSSSARHDPHEQEHVERVVLVVGRRHVEVRRRLDCRTLVP